MTKRSLLDIANLSQQEHFQRRVAMAFVIESRNILWDDEIKDVQSNAYAQSVLRLPLESFYQLATFVAADPDTDLISPTDEQITEAVKQMWDTLAGVIRNPIPGDHIANIPNEVRLAQAGPLLENTEPNQS